jgi:chromosome segregation ATPase
MTVLKRRTRDAHTETAKRNGGGGALAVAAFEYLEVEDAALVRLSGTWSGGRGHPVDMTLVVTRAGGEGQAFPAMSDGSTGSRVKSERAVWQVAFTVPVGLVESRSSQFALHADGETIDLQRPRPHTPRHAEPESASVAEDEGIEPEARMRQAEAAISWTQRQLARERDARRKAEEELAAARPEIEARRRELEHVAALEKQVTHLAEERQRRTELEEQVAELSARVRELSREHDFYEQLKVQVSELTIERDRLAELEPRVDELAAQRDELANARNELASERDRLAARVHELSEQVDRVGALEEQVGQLESERAELTHRLEDLDTERERLSGLASQVSELEAERERRLELEMQVGELTAQRDRLLPLESEVEGLRAEHDELASQAARVEQLELERANLATAAERVQDLEERLATATAERDRLKSLEEEAAAAGDERERRRVLEEKMSRQAVDRERVNALEQWVADLRRALAESRDELQTSETARGELRAELSRMRAEAESTQSGLRAELDAVRSVQAEAPPEAPSLDQPAERREDDSGLDDDLVLDDIPTPVDASDTGDFELDDDEEKQEAEPQEPHGTGETAVLSLDEVESADEDDAQEEPAAVADEVRDEALPKGDPVTCTACDAMGSCRRCGGRGRRFGRRCAECNGSGTCSVCGGPGYIWVEEPVAEPTG